MRLKYAGVDPATLTIEPSIERSLDRAVAAAARAAVRAADLHGADRASPAARRARAGAGVLAMSAPAARLGGRSGTTSSAAPTPPTSRPGSELADRRPPGRCSSSARGPGGWRSHLAGAGFDVVAARQLASELLDELAARAPRRPGSRSRPCCADARELDLGRRLRGDHRPDAARPPARRRARARGGPDARRVPTYEPGGLFAAALLADETRRPTARAARAAPRRARARRLGLLEPAARGRGRRRRDRDPPPAPAREPGRRAHRADRASVHLDRLTAEAFEREAAAAGFDARERIEVPPTADHVGSTICVLEVPLMELRLLALYPEQMNIYADRGNILFLRRRCEWRGIGFEHASAGPGERFDPGGPRPDLHRRRPGPRPAAGRRGHAARPSARRSRPRSTTAPRCSPSAAATSCSATATSSATSGSPGLGLADLETVREPGPRLIGNIAIEVDLGARAAGDRRVREPRRAHPPRPGRRSRSGGCSSGHGNNGVDGLEGVRRANLIGTYLHGPCCRRTPGSPTT